MRIRGGAGLGDAMYIRPIAEHFVKLGERVTVCNDFAEVFLDAGVQVEKFDRHNIDVLAHYTLGKRDTTTNQWQDICKSAKIQEIPLRFEWTVKNCALVDSIVADAGGRPLVLVHGGRVPMGRTDGFGKELLPDRRAFAAVMAALDDCFLVRVGKDANLYDLLVDSDLSGSTSVADLLDIATVCDGVVGQCSFAIPLAECFDKPLLCVWSSSGLAASHPYIRQITPQKVLSKSTSRFVIDDWPTEKIQEAARKFRTKPLQAAA